MRVFIVVLVKIENDSQYEEFKEIVHEWEERTGLSMEFSEFERVIQKDVNNYLIVKGNDAKSKGSYVKELSDIDNDLPIINRAVTEYLLNGVHPSETIGACDDLIEFQKVVKVSALYAYAVHNGRRLSEKTFRVFASTRDTDGTIRKVKHEGMNSEKFANTPERCFIHNEKVAGVKCPDYLDKKYYVDLAIKRITDKKTGFGVTME